MTRIMLRYVVAVLIAYSLSLIVLILIAWPNRNEANLVRGLSGWIEIVEGWQNESNVLLDRDDGIALSQIELRPPQHSLFADDSDDAYIIALKTPGSDKLFKVRLQKSNLSDAIKQEDRSFLFFVMTSLLIFATVNAIVSIPFVKRLQRHERVIRRLADGDLTARAPTNGKGPIGKLGNRINLMAERVEKLVAGQKELLRTVSHELRTPINRSHFLLDLMESDLDSTAANVSERTLAMRNNLIEQDQLISELLTYSRLETVPLLNIVKVDLAALLKGAFAGLTELMPGVEREFKLPHQKIWVDGDERLLKRVFSNLANNALRNAHSTVRVELSAVSQNVEILIFNDGKSIPSQDRQRIFEPFVKLDDGPGTGLGLAICKKIVEMHHGQISFVDSRIAGATCRLVLNLDAIPNHIGVQ